MNNDTQRALDWLLIQPELRQYAREQENDDERVIVLREATERVLDLLPGLNLAQVDWRLLAQATL